MIRKLELANATSVVTGLLGGMPNCNLSWIITLLAEWHIQMCMLIMLANYFARKLFSHTSFDMGLGTFSPAML